jgi:subtilase family serine protease
MLRRRNTRLLTDFMLILAVLSAGTLVAHAKSATLPTRHVREVTTTGVTPKVGHMEATESMRLTMILQLRDRTGLENFVKELYTPGSPSYRHFLTVEQFTETYGPTREDYETVKQWARDNGFTIAGTSRNRMNLVVEGSAASVEQALHVTMNYYQHDSEPRTFFAPDREPTPDLPFQLWHVNGLDNYSTPHTALRKLPAGAPRVGSNATTGSCPGESFCGSDMRAAYYEGTALNGSGQSLGLLEYIGTDLTDLDTYFTNAGQTNNVPITLLSVDTQSTSCTDNSAGGFCDDTEQTIDMTQSIGMAPGLSSLVMYIGTGGKSGQTVDDAGVFNAMATADPLNAQLSSSWYWNPADPTTDDPYFLEFQAQGQNLFDAAGDDGKYGSSIWPADDQYLTAVGGTDLTTTGPGGDWASETAWSDGGGGISPNKIPIPGWQVATAAQCIDACSLVYRNVPDVSANANFSFYVCADQEKCSENEYGGTSFAAPMWAGYLALTNEQALENGDSVLGFINPSIYTIGLGPNYDSDFHDITSGSNGYKATVGYDLATGWGSPNQSNLINGLIAGQVTPTFVVTAEPTTLSVAQGASGTATVYTTVSSGFSGSITLSASGAPSGVTVSFSSGSITDDGTSTATVSVGSAVAPGTYTVTVTGTSGSTTSSANISLTVTASSTGSFSLSLAKTSVTIAPSSKAADKLTATPSGGFDSTITLTASGAPSGVTIAFSPATISGGSGSSTVEIKTSSSAKAGTYTITITGTAGTVSESATLTLTIS